MGHKSRRAFIRGASAMTMGAIAAGAAIEKASGERHSAEGTAESLADSHESALDLSQPAMRPLAIPPRLKRGDRVALISPCSPLLKPELYEAAQARVKALGFVPVMGHSATKVHGYLAGTDEERARDLNRAFLDDSIDAIWCLRGGYGGMRILERLDFTRIAKHPKVFIGYSDVTALHIALQQRSSFVTFHGPMAGASLSPFAQSELLATTGAKKAGHVLGHPELSARASKKEREQDMAVSTLRGGVARGRIMGGNLTLIARLMGTPFEPDFRKALFFFEDIGEATYRIDGMLTQLLLAGKLQECRGIMVGRLTKTKSSQASQLELADVLRDYLLPLKIPVIQGFASGHVKNQTTIPCGLMAELDADRGRVELMKPAVK